MSTFRIAFAQLTSVDNVEKNLSVICTDVKKAADLGARLVVFPENSLYFRIQPGSALQGPRPDGPEFESIARLAEENDIAIFLTTPLAHPDGKFTNSTILFRPGLEPTVEYNKIHLFDVDVPGAPPVRESDYFAEGSAPRRIEYEGWTFGLSICYDLRFAELYRRYAQEVDAILIPSAFLVPTGQAHWQVLVRARAIECQAFVLAPAQAGEHKSVSDSSHVRHTYGHSLAVDPWGRVLEEVQGGPAVSVVDLDKDLIRQVRGQIPMNSHRRLK